jgi:hypothetical protein
MFMSDVIDHLPASKSAIIFKFVSKVGISPDLSFLI